MLEENIPVILSRLSDTDVVLEIGAWFRPFNRANWIIDIMPYATRAPAGAQGPHDEHYSESSWICRDVCSREPLPFPDKYFDFFVSSHLLEDIRHPVFLCSEIMRVGKAGYIEVPSRDVWLSFGAESRRYTGYYHHRWMVDVSDGAINFHFKPHFVHWHWKYHFPASYFKSLSAKAMVQYMFWEDSLNYKEEVTISYIESTRLVDQFVRSRQHYGRWRYYIDGLREFGKLLRNRFG